MAVRSSQRTSSSLTGIPNASIRFIASNWPSASGSEISPQPWARKRSGRAAVMLEILLAQRSGGGIARVGEDLAARGFLPLIERLEVRLGHVDFAADLEDVRGARDALRNVGDRADVRGNVLAHRPVAARRRQDQLSALVADGAGQPVDLRLGRHRHEGIGGKVQEAPHTGREIRDLILGEGIFQAEHRPRMRDLCERGSRSGAEPLRRGVRPNQLRKAFLQFAVLADQRIIVRVADLRRVPVVIQFVVARDLLREPHQPIGSIRLADRVRHAQPNSSSSKLMNEVHERSAASAL